jgi:uncharacterized protein
MVTNPSADVLSRSLDPTVGPIERVETHISTLVFQGPWAYKVKRPVRYEFVDLSTPEKRHALCERELVLNRRFAPDVYDSVIPIRDAGGITIDHALRMRRMPAHRRLFTLAAAGDTRAAEAVRDVARIVARVHAASARSPQIDRVATPLALLQLWDRSLDDMQRFVGGVLDDDKLASVAHEAHRYVAGRGRLFSERIDHQHIVDGHGDLLSSDIFCLDDGPRILDCLEFDDELRFGDVLLDVAFLVMDMDRLGRPDLGRQFVSDYAEFTNEHHPMSLLHHYVAYRAVVRSKVACLRGADGDLTAASEAASLLGLAESHLIQARVRLILVGGLPGSGKSTLAEGVAEATGAVVLSSDVVRKELAGSGPGARPAAFNEGIYTDDMSRRTYNVLMQRASICLASGQSVIIDASFGSRQWRDNAHEVADATLSDLVSLYCHAPVDVREDRLRSRRYDYANPSDANIVIARRMADQAEAWPDATHLDSSAGRDECRAAAEAALGKSALEARI